MKFTYAPSRLNGCTTFQYARPQALRASACVGSEPMPAMTIENVASRALHAVALPGTRRTAPSIGYRGMSDNALGAAAACAICASIASSGSDLTKSPFQYHCSPFGKNGSKSAFMAGKGIAAIQLKIGGGSALSSG